MSRPYYRSTYVDMGDLLECLFHHFSGHKDDEYDDEIGVLELRQPPSLP